MKVKLKGSGFDRSNLRAETKELFVRLALFAILIKNLGAIWKKTEKTMNREKHRV